MSYDMKITNQLVHSNPWQNIPVVSNYEFQG